MVNTIDPNMFMSHQPKGRTPSPDLGKDEFLKILMTQLQNQDPLNPMQDKDFIAQMSQFSSLEQLMNMAGSMEQLAQSQMVSPVVQYSHMIGKEVSYIDENEKVQVAEVESVSQKSGLAVLELSNGEKIYADIIEKVGNPGELDDKETPADLEEDKVVGDPNE